MPDPVVPTYPKGALLHVVTGSQLHFRGPLLEQNEEFLTLFDKKSGRKVSFAYRAIDRIELIDDGEPERNGIGGSFSPGGGR